MNTPSNRELESVLETYSLEEILELNDLTQADALEFMVDEEFISQLPDPEPVDTDVERWDDILYQELLDGQ